LPLQLLDRRRPTHDRRKRDKVARGAARGGDDGASRLAIQGRGDRLDFSVELSGKAAGKQLAFVFGGGGAAGGRRLAPASRRLATVLTKRTVNPETIKFRSAGTYKKYWRTVHSGAASDGKNYEK
jgi:hypothetical protein